MKIDEFLQNYDRSRHEFCACLVEEDGNIITCEKSHLGSLQELYLARHLGEALPPEAMAMFWLIASLHVVVVDYENQIYAHTIEQAQKDVLKRLKAEGLIVIHICDIHDHLE